MKYLFIFFLLVYKRIISPFLVVLLGRGCRFTPTCGEYTLTAIEKFGVLKGGSLAIKRILKCHPLNKPGFDPLPERM